MNRRNSALLFSASDIVRPNLHALAMDMSVYDPERRPAQSNVIDVLTIGDEATVLRPVQRALIRSGWAIRHASSVHSAVCLLEVARAAVAVLEVNDPWVDMLSCLRSVSKAPEVIVVTHEDLSVEDVLSLGAHDLLRRPLTSADLLWSIATAWHVWMKQFEAGEGTGDVPVIKGRVPLGLRSWPRADDCI